MASLLKKNPRRVLFLINTLRFGGTERNVAKICTHIDKTRYLPEVWTLIDGGEYESAIRDAGVKIRCLHRRWGYDPIFALRAARQIARHESDIIHLFQPAIGLCGAVAKTIWKCKQPMIYYEASAFPSRKKIIPFCRWIHSRCNYYMANSNTTRENLLGQGVPADFVRVVPNGHDVKLFANPLDVHEKRKKLGVSIDDFLIVTVGRLVPSKRISDLIQALSKLDIKRHRIKLLIVGYGSEEQSLSELASLRGLENAVNFLGKRRDIPELLRAADLFVFPSETEGLPNVLIEAILSKVPIVASDISGVRDVVTKKQDALLVKVRSPQDLADAILEVILNRPESKKRSESALANVVATYSIEASLKKLYSLYDEALENIHSL